VTSAVQRLRSLLRTSVVLAGLVLLGSLALGLVPVGGHYDSESFRCGSAFVAVADDGGYGGTEQFRACDQERGHLRLVALSGLALGVGLLASSGTALVASRAVADAPPSRR